MGALIMLVLASLAAWGFVLGDRFPRVPGFELSVAGVERTIQSWGMWGIAGSILLMVLHSFVPFPAEIVAMANGMLYGPLWGTLITWTGAMLGAWMAFGLARWLGRPFVRSVVAEQHREALDRWALRQGGGALLLSRFVPVISFNLINYAA
ncbi:MAG: TVP38/TMEM64 family protein, partial [Candidatus Limnocylindria bacterium]